MYAVVISTWTEHDHALLALAAAIWLVGATSLFLILRRSLDFGPHRRLQWSAISAVAGGMGVWATHFVAMLGHRHHMAVRYDGALTLLSIVAVIGPFWMALRLLCRRRDVPAAVGAGLIATAGVGLMHFIGMAAMTGVTVRYAPAPVVASVLLSALLFCAAFLVFIRTDGRRQLLVPIACAISSVVTLHFATMTATTVVMTHHAAALPALDRTWLAAAIIVATLLLLVGTGVAFSVDRYLTDLRGLANATLEGLAIVQGDRIVEANGRFAALVGSEPRLLAGTRPDDRLAAADGLPLLAMRPAPFDAVLVDSTCDRQFEAATHAIEYRGRDCVVLAMRDLTEQRAAQRQIEHMARHDALTDLPNRALLDERIAHGMALARRDGQSLALIALDLDRFKAVNDIFGHAAGDAVLCRVAGILRDAVRATDTVARVGGDEFMILQVGAAQPEGARAITARILDAFAETMDATRDPTAVGVSMGVALFPGDAADAIELRHGADIALYRAKEMGRGGACFFDAAMDVAVRERRALEHDLRHAILRRQLHVAFQPLVMASDGAIIGYEALMRWTHPDRGIVPPDLFVPIAEETGTIIQLGEWILREACAAAGAWPAHMTLAINISPVQFQVANLPEMVAAVLAETGFPPGRLELEITESVLIKDRDTALAALVRLKALGVRIVMDDFGTGYSSLSYLQSFPFDKIKIDRSFVATMEHDDTARSIVRAIVGIGRSLALPVVAEGVETAAQHRIVVEEGCTQVQGFLFGRPGPVAAPGPEKSTAA